MRRVRRKVTKSQRLAATALQSTIPLDDGTVTTPASLKMIQALIPLGLKAVEEALIADVSDAKPASMAMTYEWDLANRR